MFATFQKIIFVCAGMAMAAQPGRGRYQEGRIYLWIRMTQGQQGFSQDKVSKLLGADVELHPSKCLCSSAIEARKSFLHLCNLSDIECNMDWHVIELTEAWDLYCVLRPNIWCRGSLFSSIQVCTFKKKSGLLTMNPCSSWPKLRVLCSVRGRVT